MTNAIGAVQTGGATLARALQGVANGRLERVSADIVGYERYNGSLLEINGELMTIPAAPMATEWDLSSENLIASDGTDTTLPAQANTLYYLYHSNSSASYAPGSLRGSTTAPSVADDGFQYLATSGNGREWRFLGWARTDGSTEFKDDADQRLVANYYNRQRRHVRAIPGYSDGGSGSQPSVPIGTNWQLAHADGVIAWIANGEDSYDVTLVVAQATASGVTNPGAGIGINSTTSPEVGHTLVASANDYHYSIRWSAKGTAGEYTEANFLSRGSVAAWSYYADISRTGATADPRATTLIATVAV